jgi:hypothetical protein
MPTLCLFRANKLEKTLKEALPGAEVTINPDKVCTFSVKGTHYCIPVCALPRQKSMGCVLTASEGML